MSWPKQLFKFYLDASIHVALAVVSLCWVSYKTLNIPLNFALAGFIFCSTIVCYNFVKYGVEARKYFIVDKPYHKTIQIFSFLTFAIAVYFFLVLPRSLWLPIVILSLLSSLYAIPFLPNSKNLRSLGGLKIFLVAIIWVGFTVYLPVLEGEKFFDWDIGVLMFRRFVLILLLILPFEIRDMHIDRPQLQTLPQRYGVQKTKIFGYFLVLAYGMTIFLIDELSLATIVTHLVFALIALVMLLRTKETQSRYFASFWVEGIPILMGIVFLFF
ncbi:MAG: hypothetical protein HKP24_05560 [Croceitalea sp.]|nr:hypothetical protein [Croceitalea sp.]